MVELVASLLKVSGIERRLSPYSTRPALWAGPSRFTALANRPPGLSTVPHDPAARRHSIARDVQAAAALQRVSPRRAGMWLAFRNDSLTFQVHVRDAII